MAFPLRLGRRSALAVLKDRGGPVVDKGEGIFQNVYEMLLLDNRPSQEVATKADLSGPLENPEISSWQIIVELIRNAFFKAILPRFDHEAAGAAAKR